MKQAENFEFLIIQLFLINDTCIMVIRHISVKHIYNTALCSMTLQSQCRLLFTRVLPKKFTCGCMYGATVRTFWVTSMKKQEHLSCDQ